MTVLLKHPKMNELVFMAMLALQLLTAAMAAGEMAKPRESEHKRDLSSSLQRLRVVEEAVQIRPQPQQQDQKRSSSSGSIQGINSPKSVAKTLKKRRISRNVIDRRMAQCSQERLDSMLASCEAAASSRDPSSSSSSSSFFCGSGCSHEVFRYAAECSGQQFMVNVSGACKLRGNTNLTVECIYAVVIVTHGITACTKMVADVDPSHDDLSPLLGSGGARKGSDYVEEACCSLETSYNSDVIHEVYVDPTTGTPVTQPPLVPPWLQTSSVDYQAVVDVVGSDLCLEDVATTTTTTEATTTTAATTESLLATDATDTTGGAAKTLSSSVVSGRDFASVGSVTQQSKATTASLLLTQNRASLCVFVVAVLLSLLSLL